MQQNYKKPLRRSPLRLYFGKRYYTSIRYLQWYLGGKKYAGKTFQDPLPNIVFQHQTPLLRKLKDVDMWLQHNKVKNLMIATGKLNRIVIKPGETFSYWKLIGKATYKKGYVDGMILCPDGTFQAGVGGGLCQLSNLIYWMTLHTPLTVTERHRHSHDVFPDSNRTQPFGSGATCVYNYLDLQIYNGTDDDYQLIVYLTEENLCGEWRTTKPILLKYEVYEKEHWITNEYWGGYIRHNILHRRILNCQDELLGDEYITENHAIMMYQPLLGSE